MRIPPRRHALEKIAHVRQWQSGPPNTGAKKLRLPLTRVSVFFPTTSAILRLLTRAGGLELITSRLQGRFFSILLIETTFLSPVRFLFHLSLSCIMLSSVVLCHSPRRSREAVRTQLAGKRSVREASSVPSQIGLRQTADFYE